MADDKLLEGTVQITVRMDVSKKDLEDWVEFVTGGKDGYADLFSTSQCGYWLRGIDHIASRGWLAWEFDEDMSAEETAAFEEKWRWWFNHPHSVGRQPKIEDRVFVLDREIAGKAFAIGVNLYGKCWYTEGDANTYDEVLQLALLGELRYA